jgi:preprotein translocase subunit SecE
MADEKNVAKAKDQGKGSFGSKFVNFFKNLIPNICRPFKNMWHELRKVTWPSRQDLIKYSLIVLAFLVFMGVVIGLLDLGSTALVNLFI